MHWQTEQEKQALADFRAHNRHIEALKREIRCFELVLANCTDDQQKSWALQMIKSIQHELDQLEA